MAGTIKGSKVDGEARAEVDDKEPHTSHHVNHSPEKERVADTITVRAIQDFGEVLQKPV